MSTKRIALLILFVLGALALIAACAPAPTPVPTAAPPTTAPQATAAPQTAAPKPTEAPKATTAPTAAPQPTQAPATQAAAKYPTRAVKVYLTHGPGSGIDIVARLAVPYLSKYLGQPVVVENLEGAGGRTARAQVFKEKPDGYTLLISGFPSMQLGELVYDGQYKTAEWTYIHNIQGGGDYGIVYVSKDSPLKTYDDLVKASQTKSLKIAIPGVGSSAHLFAVLLREKAGLKSSVVQFPAAQEVMAVMSGDVAAATDTASGISGDDRVRGLAVASDGARSPMFPNVPTSKELGFPGLEVPYRVGLVGPPGMPADVVKVLTDAMEKALADPGFKADFDKAKLIPEPMLPAAFKQSNVDLLKALQDVVPSMKKDMAQ